MTDEDIKVDTWTHNGLLHRIVDAVFAPGSTDHQSAHATVDQITQPDPPTSTDDNTQVQN